MAKMKWDINGKGVAPADGTNMGYNGPDLPKGSWPAKVKRMTVGKIASNTVNKNKPRISVLLEVQTRHLEDKSLHKYHGHPIWDGLNIIESSLPFVNAFLHGLTDGSEAAKRAVESAFWDDDKGPDFKRVKVEKGPRVGTVDTHIIKIGKYQINSPKGDLMVQVTTKDDHDLKGNFRAMVTGYIPFSGEVPTPDAEDDELDDDDEDMLEDDIEDDVDEDDDVDDDEDEGDDDTEDDDTKDAEPEPVAAGGRRKKPF